MIASIDHGCSKVQQFRPARLAPAERLRPFIAGHHARAPHPEPHQAPQEQEKAFGATEILAHLPGHPQRGPPRSLLRAPQPGIRYKLLQAAARGLPRAAFEAARHGAAARGGLHCHCGQGEEPQRDAQQDEPVIEPSGQYIYLYL